MRSQFKSDYICINKSLVDLDSVPSYKTNFEARYSKLSPALINSTRRQSKRFNNVVAVGISGNIMTTIYLGILGTMWCLVYTRN